MKKINLLFFFLSFICFAADIVSDAKVKLENSKKENDKIYTEAEFQTALKEMVAKYLRRIDKGNIVPFSNELIDREKKLDLKELDLKKREDALENSKKDFLRSIDDFKVEQNKFIGCVEKQDSDKNTRLDHMVSAVSSMKPDQAAKLLSVQETKIAVEILGKLDAQKVAKIFNLMDGEISARLQKLYMNMKR